MSTTPPLEHLFLVRISGEVATKARGTRKRFQQRLVPWSESERVVGTRVLESELEQGDSLLRWGAEGSLARYCHHVTLEEWTRLTEGLGLRLVSGYCADGATGNLNEYRLMSPARDEP